MKIHSFYSKCQGLFLNCQNTKSSFVWCVFILPRQKWERFSQEFVYVEVFSQICTPDVFISHIGYLDFNIILSIQREHCITISCEPFVCFNKGWTIGANRKSTYARRLFITRNSLSVSTLNLRTRVVSYWMPSHELPPSRVCFAALLAALQRALTPKAGSRTPRTATWPILWSSLLPASSTKFAQRAALPRSTSRAYTAWSQVA